MKRAKPIASFFTRFLKAGALLFFLMVETFAENKPNSQAVLVVQPEPQHILVSIEPYALLINSFKREQDYVSVLLDSKAGVHDFQMRPSHLKKIKDADLVIWGGDSLEPFLSKALENKQRKLAIDSIEGLDRIANKHSVNDFKHDHKAGHSTDPHLWLSQSNALLIAQTVAKRLYYPEEATRKLKAQISLLSAFDKTLSFNTKSVLVIHHNAYSYLEKEIGLAHNFVIKEQHNVNPGLKHWQAFDNLLKKAKKNNSHICFVSAPGFGFGPDAKKIRQLLSKRGLDNSYRYVEIDPLASDQAYSDYLHFLSESKRKLRSCLQGE
jgi:zinc transport system substrate-binding protein